MSVLPNSGLCPKKSFVILCYRTPEPGLRSPYLGLLRGQLDYWFSKKPQGFYKFLEPCNHPLYKAGDSWTEELGFSRRIFNKAFDTIGVRYTSKTAFINAQDKFQGKLYASYHDRKTNKTYFVRNPEMFYQTKKRLSVKEPTHKASILKNAFQEKPSLNQEKVAQEKRDNTLLDNRSRNDRSSRSYGGTIGGKNRNSFTENTSTSSLSPTSLSSKIDEKKKIANDMKNIWIEEIGGLDVNHLTSTLISTLSISYRTVFKSSIEKWRTYCRQIASSQFLMGEKRGTNFKAKLSWAIQHETYERIQAGEFTLGDRKVKEKIKTFSFEQEAEIKQSLQNSSKNPMWIQVALKLIDKIGGHSFKQWFEEIDIQAYTAGEIKLKASSYFQRDYLERTYRIPLLNAFKDILGAEFKHLSYSI